MARPERPVAGAAPERLAVLLLLGASAGGIGAHVRTLAAGLVERGHDVVVCGPEATEATFGFRAAGAAFVPAPVGDVAPAPLRAVRRRLRAAAAGRDVLHAHGLRAGAVAVAPALTGGRFRPVVVTWHNAALTRGPGRVIHGALERLVARRADVTLAVAPDLVDRARACGGRDVRLGPVPAPPLPPPRAAAAQVRAALGAGDRPIVLAVARLAPQKRLDLLVDAVSGWRDGPAPLVLVAGDGPLRKSLEERARAAGAPVRFLGRRDDVADLLAAADVVALPSAWEGSPLVLQESLRAGVPTVATAVGGVPRLVGDAALLVPPGDPAALRDGIRAALTGAVRDRLRASGPVQASTWPTVARMVDSHIDLYLDLQLRFSPSPR